MQRQQRRARLDALPLLRGLAAVCVCALAARAPHAAADVFSPPAAITFSAFVGANDSSFAPYPEGHAPPSNYSMHSVTSRPSFGIALSGGGMRAATTGLGWLRALHTVRCVLARVAKGWAPSAVRCQLPTRTHMPPPAVSRRCNARRVRACAAAAGRD
jgi:hypothetical protein